MDLKFGHVSDCHLGAWRKDSLNEMGYEAFTKMIDILIEEQVNFLIISGDLYDVSNPTVEVVDLATKQLNRLKENSIPVYGIMGSHDFSPSQKTMIRPLTSANLFTNVSQSNWTDDPQHPLQLNFVEDPNTKIKIAGLRGRKKGLELKDYEQLDLKQLENEKGTKIFVLHTMLSELKPKEYDQMESGPKSILPHSFIYYAGGHIHKTVPEELRDGPITINKNDEMQKKIIYPGSMYPTNFKELESFQYGGFCVVSGNNLDGDLEVKYIPLKIREIETIFVEASNKSTVQVKDIIDQEVMRREVSGKIVVMRIKGMLSSGKSNELQSNEIIEILKEKGAHEVFINKAGLISEEYENVKIDTEKTNEQIENEIIYEHAQKTELEGISEGKLEAKIHELINTLGREIKDEEKVKDYDSEMYETFKNIFEIESDEV